MRTLRSNMRIFCPLSFPSAPLRFGGSGACHRPEVPVSNESPSVGMATPAGLEPATNSLEGYEETL